MPRIVTVDKMVNVIRESDRPALTKKEIAEGIGVSWQAIDNHEAELEDDPRVEHGKIGQATTYWLAPDADTPTPQPGQSDGDSASEQRGEDEIDEELLTAGGSPAEGRHGELVEMMSELRETHVQSQEQMQRKIEAMESQIAQANQGASEEDRADEVSRKVRAFERKTRTNSASDRSAIGFLLGIGFSIWANVFGGGEIVNTVAGVTLIYALAYAAYYLYLRVKTPADQSEASPDVGGVADGN